MKNIRTNLRTWQMCLMLVMTFLGGTVWGATVRHSGIIRGMNIWPASDTHVLEGWIVIADGAYILVEPGTVVKLGFEANLMVAGGADFVAKGVTFTHLADDSVGGDSEGNGDATTPNYGDYYVTGNIVTDSDTVWRYASNGVQPNWVNQTILKAPSSVRFGDLPIATMMPNGGTVMFWDEEVNSWSSYSKGGKGWSSASVLFDRVLAANEVFLAQKAYDDHVLSAPLEGAFKLPKDVKTDFVVGLVGVDDASISWTLDGETVATGKRYQHVQDIHGHEIQCRIADVPEFSWTVGPNIETLPGDTNVTLLATGRTFDKAGGAASVMTAGTGEWVAVTDVDWITLSRYNGEAGVSCIYAVGANFTADTRMGHIYIADKVFTVTQTGYTAAISPESAAWECAGGYGEIAITVDAGVAWTAVPNVGWITVDPSSGRSSGQVTYRVAEYDETTPRSGSVTVAGQSFTVTQTGTDVVLSPMKKSLDWHANVFEVTVEALSTTTWTPVPEASWLSVVDSGHGYGNATVMVAVGDNPSVLARTGTVAIGSKKVTVTQSGTMVLSLDITPKEATASAVGAYGNIAVYATPDAEWTAAATVDWITITDGCNGAGNGNIKYIAMANPLLSERTGQIKVTLKPGAAGGTTQTAVHTVTQGVIDPVVEPMDVSFGAAGGSASVQLTVAANTQWEAKSKASWIKVTSAANSAGSAKVSFDVAANPSTEGRGGSLEIAGKTVKVSQAGLWSRLVYDGTVFGTTSGSGFIDVQVEGDGTWTASTDAPWLTLLDTSGHGSASVMFVVDDFNTAVASRTAVVTIAGKTIEITQRGYELSIDPAVADLASNAGAGEIGITAPIDALWEAIVTVDWIQLVGETTGLGNGTLRYTVADNATGELRTGKIIISGQEYTVTQHANLTLTALVEGSGTVAGAGDYETNERVMLTATPAEGFAFTHWSGDAVGVEPQVTIIMDMPKTVTAHFIPEDAAQRLAEEKAAQGGFYTREQMMALAMGDTVIEVDPEDGAIDLAIQVQESADLSGGDWSGVDAGDGTVSVDGEGRVHIKMAPKGNTAFYRLVNGGAE